MKTFTHILLMSLAATFSLHAQKYRGGAGDGYSSIESPTITIDGSSVDYRYRGGNADGYSSIVSLQIVIDGSNTDYRARGGTADGYSSIESGTISIDGISIDYRFRGGDKDGYASVESAQSPIDGIVVDYRYRGGGSDGYTAIEGVFFINASFLKYIGGSGDGFAFNASPADVRAVIKVLLEGPYNSVTLLMNKALNTGGYLTAHFGSRPLPSAAVDSINIELRNAASTPTTRKYRPAWLLTDGTIRDFLDTTKSYVEFDTVAGNYYLVVAHRNHIAIMTASSQSLNETAPPAYDFTATQGQAYGTNPMKQIGARFCMFSGNVDGNTGIGAGDIVSERAAIGVAAYDMNDVDLNGGVGASDIVVTRSNIGQVVQVPTAPMITGKKRGQ